MPDFFQFLLGTTLNSDRLAARRLRGSEDFIEFDLQSERVATLRVLN
jgi:hypothetical protein